MMDTLLWLLEENKIQHSSAGVNLIDQESTHIHQGALCLVSTQVSWRFLHSSACGDIRVCDFVRIKNVSNNNNQGY